MQNLEFVSSTATSAVLTFDPPLENPQCAVEYEILYRDVNASSQVTLKNFREQDRPITIGKFVNTVEGLQPCSYYEFEVKAISPSGLEGPIEFTYGSTQEALPGAVRDLEGIPSSQTEIRITWIEPNATVKS